MGRSGTDGQRVTRVISSGGGAPQKYEVRPLDLRQDRFLSRQRSNTGRDAEAAVPVAGSCA